MLFLALLATVSALGAGRPNVPLDVEKELNLYHITNPLVTAGKPQGSSHHTKIAGAHNPPQHTGAFTLEVQAGTRTFVLELTKTHLFSEEFSVQDFLADGSVVTTTAVEHCYYNGHVVGIPDSSVSGSTCDGFEGIIRIHEDGKYYVQPVHIADAKFHQKVQSSLQPASTDGAMLGAHILWKESDMKQAPAFNCLNKDHHHDHDHNHDLHHHPTQEKKLLVSESSRKLLQACTPNNPFATMLPPGTGACACRPTWQMAGNNQVFCNSQCGNPDNDSQGAWCFTVGTCAGTNFGYCRRPAGTNPAPAPTPRTVSPPSNAGNRIVELLLVSDAAQVTRQGGTTQATTYAARTANDLKTIYNTLGLGINIVLAKAENYQTDVAAWRTTGAETINTYLDRFTRWFGARNPRPDNGAMLTGTDRSGGVVGLAWVNTMCGTSSSSINEVGASYMFSTEVVAHEMGHNWGCNHDSSGNTCAQSGNIMQAVGCSNCPGNTFKTFSSCSRTAIANKLSSLGNSAGNCLTNNPGTAFFTINTTCGDGFVSDGEQCDLGADNGPNGMCSSTCMFNAGILCTVGECCDMNSGLLKAAGSVCRQAMHECDLPDTCDGTNASCPQDYYRNDGSVCTEAGPDSRCVTGVCQGLDGQCADSFIGYRGNWVSGISTPSCSCSCNNACGDLSCVDKSNTSSCYSWTCPAGQTCTANGQNFTGTTNVCLCANAPTSGDEATVEVKDGTGCNSSMMCSNNSCVPAPAVPTTTCGANGVAGMTSDGAFGCVCKPGFSGATCTMTVPCNTALCASLNRQNCVVDSLCGPCKSGFGCPDFNEGSSNTNCSLFSASFAWSIADTYSGDLESKPDKLYDGNLYSHWTDSFDLSRNEGAYVILGLSTPAVLSRYDIVSSNSRISEDPSSWILYGSNDCANWTEIDRKVNYTFPLRHDRKSFGVKIGTSFSALMLVVVDILDRNSQGVTQVNIQKDTTTTPNTVMFNETFSPATTVEAKVQIAEFFGFSMLSPSGTPISMNSCKANIPSPPSSAPSASAPSSATSSAPSRATSSAEHAYPLMALIVPSLYMAYLGL